MGITLGPPSAALLSYTFRHLLFRSEQRFTLQPDALLVETKQQIRLIPYVDIKAVTLYQVNLNGLGSVERCDLRTMKLRMRLQSAHVAGPARLQDRRSSYEPFVLHLLRNIVAANPDVEIMAGAPPASRIGWIVTLIVLVLSLLGGFALLVSSDWNGMWLIVAALGATPRVLVMLAKKPSHRISATSAIASYTYSALFT